MIIGIELRHDLPVPSVRIFSDAATSEDATHETKEWALANHYVAFPTIPLARALRDGKNCYFSVACSDKAIAAAGHRICVDQIGTLIGATDTTGTVALDLRNTARTVAGCPEEAKPALRKSHPHAVISFLAVGF